MVVVITVTMVIIVIKKMARVITKMVIIMTTSLCKGRGSCRRFSVILLLEFGSLVASASHDCHHHHHHDSVIITKYFILVLGRVHKKGLKRVHDPFIKGGFKIRGTPNVLLNTWSGVAWTMDISTAI